MAGLLDASVVHVAVPAIAPDLGTSLVALQWSLTGYLLTAAALLLVGGALADRYGRRRLRVALLVDARWFVWRLRRAGQYGEEIDRRCGYDREG